jgi:hypothetical protein
MHGSCGGGASRDGDKSEYFGDSSHPVVRVFRMRGVWEKGYLFDDMGFCTIMAGLPAARVDEPAREQGKEVDRRRD